MITFNEFYKLSEAVKIASSETSSQAETALADIESILKKRGYSKYSFKSSMLTKYTYKKDGREITVDELWGPDKAILNMYDTSFEKSAHVADYTWDLRGEASHKETIQKILKYLRGNS